MSNKTVIHAGVKHKNPDTTVTYVVPSNKRKKLAGEIEVAPGTVIRFPGFSDVRMVMEPGCVFTEHRDGASVYKGSPEYTGFSCIRCVNSLLTDCDGDANCNNCTGKCKYVLCEFPNCRDEKCVKIHPHQYDLSARKSGETRRFVVYDNQTEESLTKPEKLHLKDAIMRMDALRTGGSMNAPVPGTKNRQAHKIRAKKHKLDGEARSNALSTGAPIPGTTPGTSIWQTRDVRVKKEDSNGEAHTDAVPAGAPIFGAGQSRDTQVVKRSFAQPAPMNALPAEAPAIGAGFLQAPGAQANLRTEAVASASDTSLWKPYGATSSTLGSNIWQASGAHAKGKGVDNGESGSGFARLASMHTTSSQISPFRIPQAARNTFLEAQVLVASDAHGVTGGHASSQADPFRIPQAVRNTVLQAQMPTASNALGAWVGHADRKDSFWSGDQHNEAEKRDG
jgi:hypothetical protein